MVRTTQWSPDTCGCIIEYSWDDSVQDHTHELHRVIKKCEHHASLSDSEVWDTVNSENKGKNVAHGEMLAVERISDAVPGGARKFKEGVNFDWKFEGTGKNRVLKPSIVGADLSKVEEEVVHSKLKVSLGANKLKV